MLVVRFANKFFLGGYMAEEHVKDADEFISSMNIELADDEVIEWLEQCWDSATYAAEEKFKSTNNRSDEIAFLEKLLSCVKEHCTLCRRDIDQRISELRAVR
jgi:hypothetical protein